MRRNFDLAAGEDKVVEMGNDGSGSLTGAVFDGTTSAAVPGVHVRLVRDWDTDTFSLVGYEFFEQVSDAQGRFRFDPIPEGEYQLEFEKKDSQDYPKQREAVAVLDKTTVDLVFPGRP